MTPTSDKSERTFFGIQALRAVAALLVVEHHALSAWRDRIHQPGASSSSSLWGNGAAGVDIFFVISGFVMTISAPGLAGRAHKGWLFLRRRFIRLVPLYWIFTTVRLVRLSVGPQMEGQTAGSVWHIIASYLFIPAFNDAKQPLPLISIGWTLNFEMAFYALFAVALALDLEPLLFLLPTLGLVAIVGCFDHASWPAAAMLLSPIVLEFLFGIILANFTMRRRLPGTTTSALLLTGGFVAILLMPNSGLLDYTRVLAWGLPAAAIVTGMVGLEGTLGKKLPKWMLEAGNASYAIYLVHLTVVGVVWVMVKRFGGSGSGALVAILFFGLVGCLVAGELIHRLIELPILRIFRGKKTVPGVSALPS